MTEEAFPIIENIPWINKKWGFSKKKGSKQGKGFVLLRQLRKEKYSISVDFVGNKIDGAITSLVAGAKEHIGLHSP